jgi:hypothetical protein
LGGKVERGAMNYEIASKAVFGRRKADRIREAWVRGKPRDNCYQAFALFRTDI